MDSDMVVKGDLSELLRLDIGDFYIGAAYEFWKHLIRMSYTLRRSVSKKFYFNSGVMLMNLTKIRQDGLLAKLEDYTNNNFRTYMDQDALNVVVGNDILLLPVEDNTMNFFYEHIDLPTMSAFYGRQWQNLDDVFSTATILHFASSKKPLGEVAPKEQFFRMLQRLWYKYYTPLPPLD
jgi:lipopolysaccharide biosynthesis glycosyltransferase